MNSNCMSCLPPKKSRAQVYMEITDGLKNLSQRKRKRERKTENLSMYIASFYEGAYSKMKQMIAIS